MAVNPNRVTVYVTPEDKAKWLELQASLKQQGQNVSIAAMLTKLVEEELERRQQKS